MSNIQYGIKATIGTKDVKAGDLIIVQLTRLRDNLHKMVMGKVDIYNGELFISANLTRFFIKDFN